MGDWDDENWGEDPVPLNNKPASQSTKYAPDWDCSCGATRNFGSKRLCRSCGAPNPNENGTSNSRFSNRSSSGGFGDWDCQCGAVKNFASKRFCRMCNVPRADGEASSNSFTNQNQSGDWDCSCGATRNYSSKQFCRFCDAPRPSSAAGGSGFSRNEFTLSDWDCECGATRNFGTKRNCYQCGAPRPVNISNNQLSAKKAPVTYIPPEESDDESTIFRQTHDGINFDNFDSISVKFTGSNPVCAIPNFNYDGLASSLKKNIKKSNYVKPTPVQKYAIPCIAAGRDLMACAQTGSGKTAAFAIPILSGLIDTNLSTVGALVIVPTRELADQVYREFVKLAYNTGIKPCVVYGGVSVRHQLSQISRGSNIVIATPGRLLQFLRDGSLLLSNLKYLVLDEADRMLDTGFQPDIREICSGFDMPSCKNRITTMFSATFSDDVQEVAGELLNNYLFLTVGAVTGSPNSDITQHFVCVENSEKKNVLKKIIDDNPNIGKTLVFVERIATVGFLASFMSSYGYKTTCLSSEFTQQLREEALRDFRSGKCSILVATNVASRGLDIKEVGHVINYDLPNVANDYVHRIGRTGRIGLKGKATSFYVPNADYKMAPVLIEYLRENKQSIPDFLMNTTSSLPSRSRHTENKFASNDFRANRQSNTSQQRSQAISDDEDW